MGEVKFTPGPWSQEGPDEFGDHNILHPGDALAIGAVVSNLRKPAETLANAHLIAAAPDLYEAVSRAARMFRHYEELHRAKGTKDGDDKAASNAGIAEFCEAALTKASPDLKGRER